MTTKSTSASARSLRWAAASAISGASTSPSPAIFLPSATTSTPKRWSTRTRAGLALWRTWPKDRVDRDYAFGRTLSTCAIQDDLLYISELAGYLHCLDAKTGQKYWDYDLKAEIWGSPYWVDGKIYIGTGDGDVHVFAHGKEKKVLGKIEMEDAIYSTPVACQRRVVS